jgi:hypothetical protein
VDDAYAAGLVDGEGTIGVMNVRAADTFAIRVAVAMADKAAPIMTALIETYGGRLNPMKAPGPRSRPQERWTVEGAEAAEVLRRIRPFLILKTEQADICLRLQDLINTGRTQRGRKHWTEATRSLARSMKARIHELDLRGIEPEQRLLPNQDPIAIRRFGSWWEPQDSLFGPVEFEGRFPSAGRMVSGVIYALETPQPPAAPQPTLPTPKASDTGSPGRKADKGFRPPLSEVLFDLTA